MIKVLTIGSQSPGRVQNFDKVLRLFGTAELYETGPIHTDIFRRPPPREETHFSADTVIGVPIEIDRSSDVRWKPLP
jgi:hypothetical protein